MYKIILIPIFLCLLSCDHFDLSEKPIELPELPIEVKGIINVDTEWASDSLPYLLRGYVRVAKGVTLTIRPGVKILGDTALCNNEISALIIEQGAKIKAIGTKENPIVFTSAKPDERKKPGDWGGIVLVGYAPVNSDGRPIDFPSVVNGNYGGLSVSDDSGEISYVRVEYSGYEPPSMPEWQFNGISFYGVGSSTIVQYVQVHSCKDDGFEFFGGTVNVKYAIASQCGDEGFDWTEGWQGQGQFWIIQRCGTNDSDGTIYGVEGGLSDKPIVNPSVISKPVLSNVTVIADPLSSKEQKIGLWLKGNNGGQIAGSFSNFIFVGFAKGPIGVPGDANVIAQNISNGLIKVNKILVDNEQNPGLVDVSTTPFNETTLCAPSGIAHLQTVLKAANACGSPDFRLNADANILSPTIPNGSFFTQVDFVGAMGKTSQDDWTIEWTKYPE